MPRFLPSALRRLSRKNLLTSACRTGVPPTVSNFSTSSSRSKQFKLWRPWEFPLRCNIFDIQRRLPKEKERAPSEWITWNYDVEISAFAKRVGEDINSACLQRALTDPAYVDMERDKIVGMGITADTDFLPESNETLAADGEALVKNYLPAFLRCNMPYVPEEGITSLYEYLTSTDMLAHVACHLGVADIVQHPEWPRPNASIAQAFYAVIGAINEENTAASSRRASLFIADFIATQLSEVDVNDIFLIDDPMARVREVCSRDGRDEPVPRLVRRVGVNTIQSCYWVALYSNQVLLGQSPGETLLIAEDMAARDALIRFFRTRQCQQSWHFGTRARQLDFAAWQSVCNQSISQWTSAWEPPIQRFIEEPLLHNAAEASLAV